MVIPLPSERFIYANHGIDLGSVAAVIFEGRVEYGAFADQGPNGIIGEASYALAQRLGIDPDPATGGVPEGVSYIVFTGTSGQVGTIEDHAEAVSVGIARPAAPGGKLTGRLTGRGSRFTRVFDRELRERA